MLALFWRRAGFHVHYHGQLSEVRDLPRLLETIRPIRPGIIYLSAMKRSRIHDVKEVGREVAHLQHPRPILCFGGRVFGEDTALLRGLPGVYLGPNVTTHMQRLDEVIRLYPRHSPGQIEELLSSKALLTNFQGETEATNRLRVTREPDSRSMAEEVTGILHEFSSPLQDEETLPFKSYLGWRGTPLYPGYEEIQRALPGLLLVVFPIAAIAELLWNIEISLHNTFFVDIFIAGIFALIVGNIYPLSERIQPGLIFSTRWFLRLGIILSALKFSYTSLLKSGIQDLVIVTSTVLIAVGVSMSVGKLMKINPRIAALIGTGTGICGITATMATSPAIRARDEETAITLGTILCWGTVGLFLYPLINSIFHFSPAVYGAWTGATMHDLPQLIAAAQQGGGTAALNAALLVKLILYWLYRGACFLLEYIL